MELLQYGSIAILYIGFGICDLKVNVGKFHCPELNLKKVSYSELKLEEFSHPELNSKKFSDSELKSAPPLITEGFGLGKRASSAMVADEAGSKGYMKVFGCVDRTGRWGVSFIFIEGSLLR